MTKQQFIGKYLDKKMKNHNLPYGMEYFSLLKKFIEHAEKLWKKRKK